MNRKNLKRFILFLVIAYCLSAISVCASALNEYDAFLEESLSFSSDSEAGDRDPDNVSSPTDISSDNGFPDLPDEPLQTKPDGEPEPEENLKEEMPPAGEKDERLNEEPSVSPEDMEGDTGEDQAELQADGIPDDLSAPDEPEGPVPAAEDPLPEEPAPKDPRTETVPGSIEMPLEQEDPAPDPEEYRYTLIFDANGGSGQMNPLSDRLNGKTLTLPYNTFRRTGCSFEEWNTEPDGSGERFPNRAKLIGPAAEDGALITLYAQWTLVEDRIQ